MPRKCKVCTHARREDIDAALVRGESNRRIAAQHGLSEASVRRHKANHLPAHLIRAHDAQELADADHLLAEVQDLQSRTLAILTQAEQVGERGTALRAVREARGNLELMAKLVGQLQTQAQVQVQQTVHTQVETEVAIPVTEEDAQEFERAITLGYSVLAYMRGEQEIIEGGAEMIEPPPEQTRAMVECAREHGYEPSPEEARAMVGVAHCRRGLLRD